MTRTAKKRRAPGTACAFGKRCIAVTTVGKYRACAFHAADHVFAERVRASLGGACWAAGRHPTRCLGNLQCAHIVSRRYLSLRLSFDNAVPLCGAHHTFFTHRPADWEQACRDWGVDWDELRRRALEDPPIEPEEFLVKEGFILEA